MIIVSKSSSSSQSIDSKKTQLVEQTLSHDKTPETPGLIDNGKHRRKQSPFIFASFFLALAAISPHDCGNNPAKNDQPIVLLERLNRPLLPKTATEASEQFESSSVVVPPSTTCPNGCVFVGYGNGAASLMRGELTCLGDPACMNDVALASDAPGGGFVKGVGQTINPDGTVEPSLGGTLVNGKCQGGTPSSQKVYLSPVGTDSVMARASNGSLIYTRAGLMYFPDPANNCALDLRLPEPSNSYRYVNIVSQSKDGGKTWSSTASQVLSGTLLGEPMTHSNIDRPDLFTNPFDDTIYASGGSGTGKYGVNTSLIFASTDDGKTWEKRGSPFNNEYGAYAPFLLAASKGRLFAAVCADTAYPPVNQRPVLGWSTDGGGTWKSSDGGPLSNYDCAAAPPITPVPSPSPELTPTPIPTPTPNFVPASNLAGLGYINIASDVHIAPINDFKDSNGAEVVRMAFTMFHDDVDDKKDRKKLVVVNLTLKPLGNVIVSPVMEIEAPNFGSIVRSGFVNADPTMIPGTEGKNTAVLWWLESDNPNFVHDPKMRSKYLVSYDVDDWSSPQPLSVRETSPGGPLVAAEWKHAGERFTGDYNNGSFYFYDGRLNFFITWPQDAPTTFNQRIHYNIVSVLPKKHISKELFSIGLNHHIKEKTLKPDFSGCAECSLMDLTFIAKDSGPIEIEILEDGRALPPFSVNAKAGINVIRLGNPLREQPREGQSIRFSVSLKAKGGRGELTSEIVTTSTRTLTKSSKRGTAPAEPRIVTPRVAPR